MAMLEWVEALRLEATFGDQSFSPIATDASIRAGSEMKRSNQKISRELLGSPRLSRKERDQNLGTVLNVLN